MAPKCMLAVAVGLCIIVVTSSQGIGQLTCADLFNFWREQYDGQITNILSRPRLNIDDLCNALQAFTVRVVDGDCSLNELQFAQLQERQEYLLTIGVPNSCWAVTYYPSSLNVAWPGSPVTSTVQPPPPPTTTTTTTTTTQAPTTPPPTSTTASQQTETTGSYTQCQLNIKNCYLRFHIALAGRQAPLNQTCGIIRDLAKCLLVYPECGFREEMRLAILQAVTTETIFRDWEPKECNFDGTKPVSSEIPAPATDTTTQAPTTPAPTAAPTTTQSPITQGIGCAKGYFTCRSDNQCITFAQVCDGQINCQDSSDENRCAEPQYRMAVEIGQTFVSYGCFDVVQGCANQYIMPLIGSGLQGSQPTPEALCKGYNQVLNCVIYESCPLSVKDRDRIAPKLLELFKLTMTSQSCTLTVSLPNNLPTSSPQPPAPTGAPNNCVTSCGRLNSGDYQSCLGCGVYATCADGTFYDGRPCPTGLQFDDNTKRCEAVSTTCGGL